MSFGGVLERIGVSTSAGQKAHATEVLHPTLQAAELAVAAMAGLALLLDDNSVSQEDFVDVGCPESAV